MLEMPHENAPGVVIGMAGPATRHVRRCSITVILHFKDALYVSSVTI